MNDDERFFNQFNEAPRPEFVAALQKRINQPMITQTKPTTSRRTALAFAAFLLLFLTALFAYPPTLAQAVALLNRIGVFTITREEPSTQQPTAPAPDPVNKPLTADSAQAASQLAGFTVLNARRLPAGYVQSGPFSVSPNASGKLVVSMYTDTPTGGFILINQYGYRPDDAFTDNLSPQETLEEVNVHGQRGLWIANRNMVSPSGSGKMTSTGWLRWEENGIVYTIISDHLSLAETLDLAESLK